MRMTKLAVLLSATILTASPVSAQENTASGNFMLPLCKTWLRIHSGNVETVKGEIGREVGDAISRFEKAGFCAGYVIGIAKMLTDACIPQEVTNEQLIRVVVDTTERRPATMHEDFGVLAGAAMVIAWPCPKGK